MKRRAQLAGGAGKEAWLLLATARRGCRAGSTQQPRVRPAAGGLRAAPQGGARACMAMR